MFLNWITEPLQYPFMVKALLVSSFVGIVCAILSCYITLKGWSLMGDAVSHAVVPGVIIAYILGIPFAVGAFISGFGATVAIGYIKDKTRLKEDTAIGVIFTGFFAFGLVFLPKAPSNIDLPHIIRPLWTSSACSTLLHQSGFQKIHIEQHQYRRYKIDKNYAETRIEQEFYPRGNPLLNLSEVQKELLQAEYKKAVDRRIAEQGIWQEVINLYVKARK